MEKCKEIDDLITGPILDNLLRTSVDNTMQQVSNLKVKNGGLGLPHLRTAAEVQLETSKLATEHLTKALMGSEDFCSITHYKNGTDVRKSNKVRTKETKKLRYQEAVKDLSST